MNSKKAKLLRKIAEYKKGSGSPIFKEKRHPDKYKIVTNKINGSVEKVTIKVVTCTNEQKTKYTQLKKSFYKQDNK